MGTTVRRTPITTKIPAAPDYKFLNLASFGGIVETDNPFTAETNSASDALNVYVDEYNALTTRPRVASRFLLGNVINGTILKTFSIENSLYIKSKISNVVRMYKIDNLYLANPTHTLLTNDTGVTLTEGEFSVIRYEGNDFILNDENILINDNGTLKDIKNWSGLPIPLTIERNIEGQKGIEVAKKSVFTNKHRESFELTNLETDWVYDEIQKTNAQVYKNDYIQLVENLHPSENTYHIALSALFDDNTYVFASSKNYSNDGKLYVGNLQETETNYSITDIIFDDVHESYSAAKSTHRLVFYQTQTFRVIYENGEGVWTEDTHEYNLNLTGYSISSLKISPDGTKIVVLAKDYTNNDTIVEFDYSATSNAYNRGSSYSITSTHYSSATTRIDEVYIDYNNVTILIYSSYTSSYVYGIAKRESDTTTIIEDRKSVV